MYSRTYPSTSLFFSPFFYPYIHLSSFSQLVFHFKRAHTISEPHSHLFSDCIFFTLSISLKLCINTALIIAFFFFLNYRLISIVLELACPRAHPKYSCTYCRLMAFASFLPRVTFLSNQHHLFDSN